MLYTYRSLATDEWHALDKVAEMRYQLRYAVVQEPRRWTGLLARITRARALRTSNSIEGINVSAEDAMAAVDNEDPAEADKPSWQAVLGYQAAMDYILQRCRDSRFRFTKDVILAVHFMISQHDLQANPGNFRPGWVGVRNSHTGEIVHEGVDRDQLEPLVDELIDYMNSNQVESVMLKAAMAHLNLALLHPFSDGNGRTARCLQTAVLASEGIVAPIFSSIEEYIGRNQQEYYDVLAQVGGGGWHPERDCKPWVRYCITGHYRQAQTLLRRTKEIEHLYEELLQIVRRNGLPERTTLGLLEAAIGHRVRNASYRVSADVSNNLASRDLKALVDSGLLVAEGEKRGRYYIAGVEIKALRARTRLLKRLDNPFAIPESVQPSLF
ncbi:Cell filamentation protein Fic [Candidatus Defluviicoccus seviourii]|uniref:Cell filamentation protein Fic n=2 Tax=root TaxID=1 RepID=A0A564WC76_9PROT|nr:Cell filamentation protein Fic [uncultured Defluviicoccus sp.]VUX45891.1 Cell filamentation protein Fic [Candidatus Defluviicoccus seviourii]